MSSEQDPAEVPAGEHAREALTQWGRAIRLGALALSPAGRAGSEAGGAVDTVKSSLPDKPSLPGKPSLPDAPSLPSAPKKIASRLSGLTAMNGGGPASVIDSGLSKLGTGGKAVAALRKGSRVAGKLKPDGELVDKLTPDGGLLGGLGAGGDGHGDEVDFDDSPIPIQESIVVAVPVNVAYDLCTRFEEYPGFIAHVERAEREPGDEVSFKTRLRGSTRRLEVEIYDRVENERIDWRSVGGMQHSGVITFHELAPRLTHIELSIDFEPQNIVQRISRSTHMTQRMIRSEMRRFKAFAELGEDEGGDPQPLAEQQADEERAAEEEERAAEDTGEDEDPAEDEEPAEAEADEDLTDEELDDEELDDEELTDEELTDEELADEELDAEGEPIGEDSEEDLEAEEELDDDVEPADDEDFEEVEGELSGASDEDAEFDPDEAEQVAH